MNRNAPIEYIIISQSNEIARNGSPEYREAVGRGGWVPNGLIVRQLCGLIIKCRLVYKILTLKARTLDGACVTTSNCATNFLFYRPQRSLGKVIFSQASVILLTGGCMAGGACMAGGHVWRGACVAGGMHGGGHAWLGHAWPGEGGMHGWRGYV